MLRGDHHIDHNRHSNAPQPPPKGPARTKNSTGPLGDTKSVRCTDFTPGPFFTTGSLPASRLRKANSLRPPGVRKLVFTTGFSGIYYGPPPKSLRPPSRITTAVSRVVPVLACWCASRICTNVLLNHAKTNTKTTYFFHIFVFFFFVEPTHAL